MARADEATELWLSLVEKGKISIEDAYMEIQNRLAKKTEASPVEERLQEVSGTLETRMAAIHMTSNRYSLEKRGNIYAWVYFGTPGKKAEGISCCPQLPGTPTATVFYGLPWLKEYTQGRITLEEAYKLTINRLQVPELEKGEGLRAVTAAKKMERMLAVRHMYDCGYQLDKGAATYLWNRRTPKDNHKNDGGKCNG